jgi:putative monooxygenase
MTPVPIRAAEIAASSRLGGELRAVLTPGRVDATSGFLGTGRLPAGERITEHYHPYSDEFVYLFSGELALTVDGESLTLAAGEAVMIRRGQRHVFLATESADDHPAEWVYVMAPLAPRPDLGHVDTAPAANPDRRAPSVGTRS